MTHKTFSKRVFDAHLTCICALTGTLQVQKKQHDRRHRVQELPPFKQAEKIRIKTPKELQRGKIKEQLGYRSYNIQTNTGVKKRNRRDIRRITGETNAQDPAPWHSETIPNPRENRPIIATTFTEDLLQIISATPQAVADANTFEKQIAVGTPSARHQQGPGEVAQFGRPRGWTCRTSPCF